MKYKVGDEVLVRAKIITGVRKYFGVEVGDNSFDVSEENIVPVPDMTAEEAWGIAKKIFLRPPYGGFNATELEEIFRNTDLWELTPQQAKVKIEAWEAEKEIKVGDVVIETSDAGNEYIGVVTQITSAQKSVCIVYSDGSTNITLTKNIKKTGRHIDIEGILNQIGGNE